MDDGQAAKRLVDIEVLSGLMPGKDKQLLSHLLDHLPIITYICAPDGDYAATYCGGSVEKTTGYSPEDFVRDPSFWISRVHPDDKQRLIDNLPALYENGYHEQEYRFRTADGSYIWVTDLLQLVYDDHGKPLHIVGCWYDVSNRKAVQEELARHREALEDLVQERTQDLQNVNTQLRREVEERKLAEQSAYREQERLAVILESIGDAVIALNGKGCVTLLNGVAEQFTGWSEDDAIGVEINKVLRLVEDDTNVGMDLWNEVAADQKRRFRFDRDLRIQSTSGSSTLVSVSVAPIRGTEGVVVICRDISQERRVERELQKSQKLESLGVLAGGIAHDFNNFLTGILGGISIVADDEGVTEEAKQILASAEDACVTAKGLTDQLLTFSKGGQPIKKEVALEKLAQNAIRLALGGSACNASLTIEAESLWKVDADEGQVNQVFNNLLINASQSMPNGGQISVHLSNVSLGEEVPELPAGKYVRVVVSDEGKGICSEYQDKVFDPYFTTKKEGSGLGLTVVYSIVKNHQGSVMIHSDETVGTTVTIYLPAVKSADAYGESNDVEVDKSSGGHILLVDDDRVIREVARRMLERLGYQVTVAEEGESAIEIFQSELAKGRRFDCVVLDLTIRGGMGGKDTLVALREYDPNVAAVVSSGYSRDPVMAEFESYGFDAVLVKPYDLSRLGDSIADALAKRQH